MCFFFFSSLDSFSQLNVWAVFFLLLLTTIARERGLIGSGWWLCVLKHRVKNQQWTSSCAHNLRYYSNMTYKIPKVLCFFLSVRCSALSSNRCGKLKSMDLWWRAKRGERNKKYRVGIKQKSPDQRRQNCIIIIKYFVRFGSLFLHSIDAVIMHAFLKLSILLIHIIAFETHS